ncbi:MAG: TIGR02147 family protein [Pseudomonadota bacterium]
MKLTKPHIFEFDDYRKYLKTWYEWKKQDDPKFSHRVFCAQAEFKSPNHLLLLIQGKRNISLKTIIKYISALQLKDSEAQCLETLIKFNHATDMPTKARHLKELSAYWGKKGTFLSKEQYRCLANWYYTAILELVNLEDFRENETWIVRKLKNLITPVQARKAINTLLALQLLKRNIKGKLIRTQSYLTTGSETNSVMAFLFHEQMIKLGLEALKETSSAYRNISSLTFTVRKEDYDLVVNEINDFRYKLCSLLENRKIKNQDKYLYQFNLHLFPIGEL